MNIKRNLPATFFLISLEVTGNVKSRANSKIIIQNRNRFVTSRTVEAHRMTAKKMSRLKMERNFSRICRIKLLIY